jgi:single-strand DNA-binding protein
MASVNKVILLGRLGQDPEIKYTQNEKAVAKFSLATDESWKNRDGEKQQKTTWHTVIAWEKLAEIVGQYLKKGDQVYIEGKIQVRSWEDTDGNKRYATEIVAANLVMLGGNKKEDGEESSEEKPSGKKAPEAKKSDGKAKGKPPNEDDIPF